MIDTLIGAGIGIVVAGAVAWAYQYQQKRSTTPVATITPIRKAAPEEPAGWKPESGERFQIVRHGKVIYQGDDKDKATREYRTARPPVSIWVDGTCRGRRD